MSVRLLLTDEAWAEIAPILATLKSRAGRPPVLSDRLCIEAVLYRADLEKSLDVCPKCGHHNRVTARERLDMMLDAEGRYEIGSEVIPVDFLKFVDSRRYTDRLDADSTESGESDALVVMQGAIKTLPVVIAAFEFRFMGGSMGSGMFTGRRPSCG